MSLVTQEARAQATTLLLELKPKLSVELSEADWRALLRQAERIAQETVIICKNRFNNM